MQPVQLDVLLGARMLMNLADERDYEFEQKCQIEYNKATKPDHFSTWEAYYKALSTPTESDTPSSD